MFEVGNSGGGYGTIDSVDVENTTTLQQLDSRTYFGLATDKSTGSSSNDNRDQQHNPVVSQEEIFASLRVIEYTCPIPPKNNSTNNDKIVEATNVLLPLSSISEREEQDYNNKNNKNTDDNDDDEEDAYRRLRSKMLMRIGGGDYSFWEDCYYMIPGSVPHSIIVGTTIGIVCGIISYVYYTILEWLLQYVWKTLPQQVLPIMFPTNEMDWIWIPIVGYTMAIGVGLSVQYIGEPGDLAYTVQCVHEHGYIEMDHVLPMVCASQFSILGGGSLGPEAPLVAICASFSGYISRTIFQLQPQRQQTTTTSGTQQQQQQQPNKNVIRKHTLMGMACALSAFFGAPMGGSIFALEINNRLGIEYYEHTIEAIYSGMVCLCVFRTLAGLEISSIWNLSDVKIQSCTATMVVVGGLFGLVGAIIAALFSMFHQQITMPFLKRMNLLSNTKAVPRALVGATGIVLIGLLIPQTMFWGEEEFPIIATGSYANELPHVYPTSGLIHYEMNTFTKCLLVGIMKMIVISLTVAGGYRGGFIFPFFVAGGAFGQAFQHLLPVFNINIPIQITTLCIAAGINVAITRTSIATTIILTFLSNELYVQPVILAASIVSLFATSYMPFIRSQKKRNDLIRQSEK